MLTFSPHCLNKAPYIPDLKFDDSMNRLMTHWELHGSMTALKFAHSRIGVITGKKFSSAQEILETLETTD